MASLFLAALFAGCISATSFSGASSGADGLVFSVPRIRTQAERNGPAARQRALAKHGINLEYNETAITAFSRYAFGSVNAIPTPYNAEYICPVVVGGQTLHLDFDTGSSDLWMFSSYLDSATIGNHSYYSPDRSASFQSLDGEGYSLVYGDGSGSSGLVGTDTVNVGGATVTSQAIEMATSVSASFQNDQHSDGILGLAFDSINSVQPDMQLTFFTNLMLSLKRPIFTANLKEDGTGTYEFGALNHSEYVGALYPIEVDYEQGGFWEFQSTTYSIGRVQYRNDSLIPSIADSGTSLMLMDDSVVANYYRQVPGAAYYDSPYSAWLYPCASVLPDFGIAMGAQGTVVTVPGRILRYSQVTTTLCYGAIQSNSGYRVQILGDVLYRSCYLAHFGIPHPRMGVGQKAS